MKPEKSLGVFKPSESRSNYIHTPEGLRHVCHVFGVTKCTPEQVRDYRYRKLKKDNSWGGVKHCG